jgi:threonine/homoserine/homoserine lactone efflux protein
VALNISTIGLFAVAILVTAGTPGPSIAALVSRVIVSGWRDALPFVAAMWMGEVLWLTTAVFGLTSLAESMHWAFTSLKYIGIAYLFYLAWSMWHAPVDMASIDSERVSRMSPIRMFSAGFAVTMGNPKIMVFYVALLPNIVQVSSLGVDGWFELCITLLVLLALIDSSYMALAGGARQLLKAPATVRIANRVGAGCMAGAAVGIAAK